MTLTEKGLLLRRIYSEHDLELCEALLAGTFDKLDANGLAAVLSSLVYEARRGGDGEPRHYPGGISGPIAIASSKLKAFVKTSISCARITVWTRCSGRISAFSTSCMNGRMAVRWDRACTAPT